ncbi:MAG: histidine phosphatase family protein [Gammaproteobacteria bacterium]
MALYIIRHGETAGNVDGIVQFPDVPLNERGLTQARLAGKRLRNANLVRIIASDYDRTRMTAEQIQAETNAPLEFNELLRERHFGDLRGKSHSEIGDLHHPELAPPNGETWPMFHRRVDQAWAMMQAAAAEADGDVAIVTHGMVCFSLALRHLQTPENYQATPTFGNTSITQVEPAPPWRALLINCCAHLDELNADRTERGHSV